MVIEIKEGNRVADCLSPRALNIVLRGDGHLLLFALPFNNFYDICSKFIRGYSLFRILNFLINFNSSLDR